MKNTIKYLVGLVVMVFVITNAKEDITHAGMRGKNDRVEYEVDCVSVEIDEARAMDMLKSGLDLDATEAEGEFWNQVSTFASPRLSVAAIPVNETKKVSWKSAKFETGLPGYVWYWSIDVTLRANSSGTGYEYVSATYSIHTVEQFWKILAMQYRSYSCLLSDYYCYYSTSSDRVNFEVHVVYDISYLLQNQTFATSYSVPGGDTHSVMLK